MNGKSTLMYNQKDKSTKQDTNRVAEVTRSRSTNACEEGQRSAGPLLRDARQLSTDDTGKVQVINDFFVSVFIKAVFQQMCSARTVAEKCCYTLPAPLCSHLLAALLHPAATAICEGVQGSGWGNRSS